MDNLRMPSITAKDSANQLVQMKSYLFQLVEQMNYTINLLEKTISELDSKESEDITSVRERITNNQTAIKNSYNGLKLQIDALADSSLTKQNIPAESGLWKLGGYRDPDTNEARFMWFEWD